MPIGAKTNLKMQTPGQNSEALNELYASLSPDAVETLRQHETRKAVPAKTKLIELGKRPDHLIMLSAGTVEVLLPSGEQAIVLSTAGPGKVFGLRALVSGESPQIEVICRTECGLRLLPAQLFTRVLRSHPQMYFAVAKLLSADLQLAQAYLKERSRRKLRAGDRQMLVSSDRA
jgi:CRP-like cAMP-binding protein